MAKKILSHYSPDSPVFANKKWAEDGGYISYYKCNRSSTIKKSRKGYKQWGRKKNLYKHSVENSLDKDLENKVGPLYEKILKFKEFNADEKIIWSQFLMSQLVRTPTFMKYEQFSKELYETIQEPINDRVGCEECEDLNYVVNRDWCYLLAHEDDFFIRTDNPVLQTGFIERPETCLFYPLTPRICFLACSMSENWDAFNHKPNVICGRRLGKGTATMINFHLAKSAGESLIINPKHENELLEKMYIDTLGVYPQPPFTLLHTYNIENEKHNQISAYVSIRILMNYADKTKYPSWLPFELEPYYQINNQPKDIL